MTFIAIPQSNEINGQFFDDLIYPVDTKDQIAEAIAEMSARGIDQLPVYSTSLTLDELDSWDCGFPVVNVLIARVIAPKEAR